MKVEVLKKVYAPNGFLIDKGVYKGNEAKKIKSLLQNYFDLRVIEEEKKKKKEG